jgi:thiol-disulfide isomerase/thioredoxin
MGARSHTPSEDTSPCPLCAGIKTLWCPRTGVSRIPFLYELLAVGHRLLRRHERRSTHGDNLETQPREQLQGEQEVIRFIRDPDPAPPFAVKGMDGKTANLAGALGKAVLLNFWATWCGPCRMEVPDLVELQKEYKDQLQVIGLVVDDADEDAVRKFEQRYNINYPIAMATDEMRFQFGACRRCQRRSMRGQSRLKIPEKYF